MPLSPRLTIAYQWGMIATPSLLSLRERASLLRFYADAGVDCLLEETAVDRFAESTAALAERQGPIVSVSPEPAPAAGSSPANAGDARPAGPPPAAARTAQQPRAAKAPRPAPAVPDEAAIENARVAARQAASIEALKDILDGFEGCNLKFSARNTVFADGNPKADVMFVGEAPGREEDIQGLPFVGRAGQLLDLMLAAIGRDRESAYITNMIFWRPPGNRTPTPHEIAMCRPFTERHIELIDPSVIVFLGNVSTKNMLDTNRGILSLRGTWSEYALGEKTWPALPTLHPAYLLRNPAHKKLAWRDFLALRARLDGAVS